MWGMAQSQPARTQEKQEKQENPHKIGKHQGPTNRIIGKIGKHARNTKNAGPVRVANQEIEDMWEWIDQIP